MRAVHRARERADRAQGTTASYRPFTARRGALDAVFARHGSTAPISLRWRCAHVVDAEMMPRCSETVPRAGVRSDRPRKACVMLVVTEESRGPSSRRAPFQPSPARASRRAPKVFVWGLRTSEALDGPNRPSGPASGPARRVGRPSGRAWTQVSVRVRESLGATACSSQG